MDASLIKKLKDMTNAGLMDCKKALEASNENIDEAIKWLREKGISKAAKKADRIAAEGSSLVMVEGNNAVIVEAIISVDIVTAANFVFIVFFIFIISFRLKSFERFLFFSLFVDTSISNGVQQKYNKFCCILNFFKEFLKTIAILLILI